MAGRDLGERGKTITMALHDLTPQLRTRLGRLERVVGWFVGLAVVILLAGLAYYVYRVADRKGWFVRKLPYFTFVDNANGLRMGDPVRLMGFDVGEITEITAQPPFDYFNVYVGFVVKEEFVGYLWDDSRAIVASTDLLGKRSIEVIKGTNGPPTYLFHPLRQVSLGLAESIMTASNYCLAQAVYDAKQDNRVLAQAYRPLPALPANAMDSFRAAGISDLWIFDQSVHTKWPSAVWDYKEGRYRAFERKSDKGFFLPPREAPALAARLENVADTVEGALPNLLGLTNRINRVLDQTVATARDAEAFLQDARPLLRNLTRLSTQLGEGPGALGDWLMPSDLRRQLSQTLDSANTLLTHSDQNVDGVSSNVTVVLVQLANLTSNLNAQVVANSNILSEISMAVTNADHLMQGLKRHWLLRSAFREGRSREAAPSRSPAGSPGGGRAVAPKYSDPR